MWKLKISYNLKFGYFNSTCKEIHVHYEGNKIRIKVHRPSYRIWICRSYLEKTSRKRRPNKMRIGRSEVKREWNEWLRLTRVREWMHDRLRKCMCRHVTSEDCAVTSRALCQDPRWNSWSNNASTDGLHLWRSSL